jgi:hypothetical protein
MNVFVGLGYLLEAPKVVKEKGKTIARFIMVIRKTPKEKPVYIKSIAVNNIADLFYINRQKGNLFSFSVNIVSSEVIVSNTGSTFENYLLIKHAILIDRAKTKEKGMGFKEVLEMFPPEALVRRKQNDGKD